MKHKKKKAVALIASLSMMCSSIPFSPAVVAMAEDIRLSSEQEEIPEENIEEINEQETAETESIEIDAPEINDGESNNVIGDWGENINYLLNKESGELIIRGSGDMKDSTNYYSEMPFYAYKDYIKSVVFEEGITSVCNYALLSCEQLTSVKFAESITKIGYSAFRGCSSLQNITLPENLEIIEKDVFYNCPALESIEIPDTVTELGESAFYDCKSLESLKLSKNITSIGEWTFYGCSSIKSIEIPESVTSIGELAFYDCSALENINIPGGVTEIGKQAFSKCKMLENIDIPDTVTSIGEWAFGECGIKELVIPSSVSSIGNYAFSSCKELEKVVLSEGVEYIGQNCFSNCTKLENVSLPSTLKTMGSNAFSGTPFMEAKDSDFVITDSGILFSYNGDSEDIVIPDNVTVIGEGVFKEHYNIKSVSIPDTVESIGANAFYNCESLESINIPENLKEIGESAFYGCKLITEITFPDSLTEISASCFENCESLTTINNIHENISRVGADAFAGTPFLENNENDVIIFGSVFYKYKGEEANVVVPDGITSISKEAFLFNINLESVSLPDTLVSIGENAFVGCQAMSSVIIPESVTEIGKYALGYYCNNGFSGFFTNIPNFTILSYPGSCAEKYAEENEIKFQSFAELEGSCGENATYSIDISSGVLTISGSGDMTDYENPSYSSSDEGIKSPFYNYSSFIKSIVIEEGITSTGTYSFYGLSDVNSVELPSTLKEIHKYSFYNTASLNYIDFPKDLEIIDYGAFYFAGLKELILPGSLKNLADSSFACNKSLKALDIPEGIESIGTYTFENCSCLQSLSIPSTVSSISNSAFNGCSSLETINLSPENQNFSEKDGVIYNSSKSSIIIYPANSKTEVYTIPPKVTTFPNQLYNAKNLKCLIVPDNVTSVSGNLSLDKFSSIERIIFYGNAPTQSSYYYDGKYPDVSSSKPVKITCSFSAEGWEEFMESCTSENIYWENLDDLAVYNELKIENVPEKIKAGDIFTLQAKLNPILDTTFIWSSSNENVAVVSSNGTVKATGKGSVIISCTSESGKYYDETEFIVAAGDNNGDVVLGTLPDYDFMELDKELVGNSFTSKQFPCESLNGVYFLNGSTLSFYSLLSHSVEWSKSLGNVYDTYEQNNILYIMHENTYEAFDLEKRQTVYEYSVPAGFSGKAIGADSQNRVYAYCYNNKNSVDRRIFLMNEDGEQLSKTSVPVTVYNFSGFDESNGKFYMETYYDFYSWGYHHPGRALNAGVVVDDEIFCVSSRNSFLEQGIITRTFDCIEYLCQDAYFKHQNSADLLGDKYLVTRSPMTSSLTVRNSDQNSNASLMKLEMDVKEYDVDSTYTDYYSVGVRTVYNPYHDSIIVYNNNKGLVEYMPDTATIISSFELKDCVFSLNRIGDHVIAVEKSQDGDYTMELIKWKDPATMKIICDAPDMLVGTSQQLSLSVTDSQLDSRFVWKSSDDTVVSVTSNGKITTWKEGKATISCSSPDGSMSDEVTITVGKNYNAPEKTDNIKRTDGFISNNVSDNNYTVWNDVAESYLAETPEGDLLRIENTDDGILIEKHSMDGTLLEYETIEKALSIFGGFFSSSDYYYLVFGQENKEESSSKEIMRIVKYTKDWKYVDKCSVFGSNTYLPFDAGNMSIDEADGKLYIHTCHKMYKDENDVNHQANMTFVLDTDKMEMVDSFTDVLNIYISGYVSHSFAQYVRTDDEYIFRVDHGDSGPRSVTLTRCKIGDSITNVASYEVYKIKGYMGNNSTGVSVGGLELSDENCLIAMNSIDMNDESSDLKGKRNIMLLTVSKNGMYKNEIWLTDYKDEDDVTVCTPQIVKISNDAFVIMWEERTSEGVNTRVVTCNGDGTLTSDIKYTSLRLSDCQPIVTSDNIVKWYVTNGNNLTFYSLNPFATDSIKGSNIEYSYDEETKTLKISGSGTMLDYENVGNTPWYEYISEIENIVIEDGITSIGSNAFYGATSLKSVKLPESLTDIGEMAFLNCLSLTEIKIPDSVEYIGNYALGYAKSAQMLPLMSFKITGGENTAAQKYATENSISFSSGGRIAGDANSDGVVNLKDAVVMRRFIADGWDVEIDEEAADVNGDNTINMKDVVLIRRYNAGGWDITLK